jgi:hypothetical protein
MQNLSEITTKETPANFNPISTVKTTAATYQFEAHALAERMSDEPGQEYQSDSDEDKFETSNNQMEMSS